MTTPLYAKDCTLAVMATGEAAESLIAMRDILHTVSLNSIYHHFWGGRIGYHHVHPEYLNDFAYWAHQHLHDEVLSERLSIIDPTDYRNLEDLRKVIIDIIEDRIEDLEFILWSRGVNPFHFAKSKTIVFDLGITASHPSELTEIIPKLPASSIFFHFIDARIRTENGLDDFSVWLTQFKGEFQTTIDKIRLIDPYFLSLSNIRQKLGEV